MPTLLCDGEGNTVSRARRVAARFSGVRDPAHVLMSATRKPGGPVQCRRWFHGGRAEEILQISSALWTGSRTEPYALIRLLAKASSATRKPPWPQAGA